MKRFIFAILISTIGLSISAQNKYSGGIEGGLTYSWLTPDNKKAESVSGKLGFTYGIFMDRRLSNTFSLSLGVSMLDLGGTVKYDHAIDFSSVEKNETLDANSELYYKIKYIEMPFSIKGKTQEIGYITYFAKAGVTPLIAIKSRADISHSNIDDEEDFNNYEEINLFGVGFHIGAGLEYSLGGSTSLIVELIYANNHVGFVKDNEHGVKIVTNVIQLKTGIKF